MKKTSLEVVEFMLALKYIPRSKVRIRTIKLVRRELVIGKPLIKKTVSGFMLTCSIILALRIFN